MQHSNKKLTDEQIKKMNAANRNASVFIQRNVTARLSGIQKEISVRTHRASNELRNAALYVLRGKRAGRLYRVPGTMQKYRASAPGESPAVRTGLFRLSWGTHVHAERNGKKYRATAAIESRLKAGKYLLGEVLEEGTQKAAPRPYRQKIINRALPKIKEIYTKPYN